MKVEKYLLKIINWLIILTVVGSPLFYWKTTVYPYTFSKTIFFQIIVEILFALWLALAISNKKYRPKKTPIILSGGVFLLLLVFTGFTGVDAWRSFWGTIERSFGIFTLLHFAAFGVVLSSLKEHINFNKIIFWSLGTALVVSLVAFLQLWDSHLLLQEYVSDRPGATFGNPSFLAGYLTFHIFIALYFLVGFFRSGWEELKGRKFNIGFLVLSLIVCGATLFQTQTRGDLLGLGVGILVLFLMMALRPIEFRHRFLSRRGFYAVILGLVILGGAGFWTTRTSDFWANVPGLNRFKEISLNSSDLLPRISAMKAAWEGFKERPILGWGWDNFNVVYNKNYDPRILSLSYQETRFDKPHNYLLEYLVVGGAPLILAYLAFLFFAGYEALKLKDKLLGNFFIAFLVAYVVRGAFLFETLGPLLAFFLFLGWIDNQHKKETFSIKGVESHDKIDSKNKNFGLALSICLISVFVLIYTFSITSWRANHGVYKGFIYLTANRAAEAIQNFKEAVGIWSPYRWFLQRDYAAAMTENFFYHPERIPKEEVILALKAMEESTTKHPKDAYGHYALVDMYNQASDIDPENFFAAAERHAAIALELSPNRQQVLFSLSKTKSLRGDLKGALRISKEALDLNPEVADAHFYYGLFLHVDGQMEAGYQELKKAIELGREWKNYHELLVVGNFFADSGHIEEAVELYKEAEEREPVDLEVKIKLGIAYYFNKQKDLAREKILEVMTKFDITTSGAYRDILPILRDLGLANR